MDSFLDEVLHIVRAAIEDEQRLLYSARDLHTKDLAVARINCMKALIADIKARFQVNTLKETIE